MAKKIVPESIGFDAEFTKDLAEAGLGGFFKKVIERPDMTVEVLSTGLPRLDTLLHVGKLGLPKGRKVEVYSKDPEVGKTSISLTIGAHWQKMGQKVVIVDIEDTITEDYLVTIGYDMHPAADSGMYPIYLAKGYDIDGNILPAEEILENIQKASNIVDLIIVDSIGALVKRSDLEKEIGNATVGGVSKNLWEYFRKTTHSKATTIWINQALPQIGVYSPAGIKYKTSGGNAMPFATSIRLELRLVEKLKGKDEEIYGVVIDFFTAKNKVSPPLRHVKLTYLNGEGFSAVWDLLQSAITSKIIEKNGAWFSYKEEKLGQGELKVYQLLKENTDLQAKVREALNVQSV